MHNEFHLHWTFSLQNPQHFLTLHFRYPLLYQNLQVPILFMPRLTEQELFFPDLHGSN